MFQKLSIVFCLFVSAAGLSACGHSRGSSEASLEAGAVDQSAQYEEQLRALVRRHIETASRSQQEAEADVLHRRPYYYKEYSVYPDGADTFEVDIQETESRTVPYVADVRIAKLRYATRLHRERREAEADTNFLRDTGEETLTFEWRGGAWKRVGALYVAEKTEESVNGEWVTPREEVQRTVASEEEPGWWGRTWSKITDVF